MIEKKDLRYGNWVSRSEKMEGREFATIEEIKRFGNITLLEYNEEEDFFWESHLSCIYPIPLTNEMVKLKFEEYKNFPIGFEDFSKKNIRLQYKVDCWDYYCDNKKLATFKYVHELQNIVFDLEKIEMEFNF